jgi:hypothetical protein
VSFKDLDPHDPTNRMMIMELCHQQAHDAEHDVEDGLFLTITRREVWLMMLAFTWLSESLNCMDDPSTELMERVAETLEVQKPHWIRAEET